MCNYLPDEVALHGINIDQLSITRKNRFNAKECLKRIENQYHTDMKVPMLIGTNFEEFDIDFIAAVRRKNYLIGEL